MRGVNTACTFTSVPHSEDGEDVLNLKTPFTDFEV